MPFQSDPSLQEYVMPQQLLSNWCWAAATLFICQWHDKEGCADLSQGKIVASVLGNTICSRTPPHPLCNQTVDLADSLEKFERLQQLEDDRLPADVLLKHFSSGGAPLGCQVNIPGIGGHAIVLINAKTTSGGNPIVQVGDPADGTIQYMNYQELCTDYQGRAGAWVRTYYTK